MIFKRGTEAHRVYDFEFEPYSHIPKYMYEIKTISLRS